VSELAGIAPLLTKIAAAGVSVVSTCEELSYPWKTQPDLARQIDEQARSNGVAVLGTGINPGFLMDFLPTAATGLCRTVDSIVIERIQDASFRRLPFRQKIGAGLTPSEFEARTQAGKIRHVGLTESMHMVAARLGWEIGRTEDVVEPVIAESDVKGDDWIVTAGHATGVQQTGRAFVGDREVLTLNFRAAVGQNAPHDSVHISGTPALNLTIPGGVNGDVGTCAVVANAIPVIANATPGLHTMVDLPPLSCAQ
jgi:4-hydroxy-tetrahydrodipicolinate reductase